MSPASAEPTPEASQDEQRPFHLTQGGPFYRVEQKLRISRKGSLGISVRTAVAFGITFVPLVLLAAYEGLLLGPRVTLPFLMDLTVYARFALGVPLLLYAEPFVDHRFAIGVTHFRTCHLLEGQARTDFGAALSRLERTRDSLLPEIVLLTASFALTLVGSLAAIGRPVSSWVLTEPGVASSVTLAGRWLQFVSMPIFTFLVLRWLWRVVLWSRFLFHVSRADLRLIPTHPDAAGGLGFLGMIHTAFGALLVPLAASVSARGVQWVQFGGGTWESLRNVLIAFIVLALIVAFGPLQVFVPKLFAARRRGLLEYARLATDYTRQFDEKWVRKTPASEDPLLGTADIQSLADLANSYQIIQRMRVLPLSRQNALALVMATLLPMVPFLLVILPLEQLLRQVAQLILR